VTRRFSVPRSVAPSALLPALLLAVMGTAGARPVGAQGSESVAAADASVELPVATRRLPRGTVLAAGDFTIARVVPRSATRGVAAPVASGWVTRRIIQAGEVLRPPAVVPAPLVAAGQAVQFTYVLDGLHLTLDGVAPVAGSLGDTIPVRLGAKRRMSGIVTGPARVSAIDSSRTP